ncbi:hypothetical protein [Nevskia ramosa]|uniref:hypothetical protein n=1 Tax=Nevskia ramosa TaxID=64002 RepID=UPI003D0FD789
MSLPSIRATYGVPAKRGCRVEYTGGLLPVQGIIVGAAGSHLRIRLDGRIYVRRFHPTWELRYLPESARA